MPIANETANIIKIESIPKFQRGDGVITTLLVGTERAPDTVFTSGLTSFPPGRSARDNDSNSCWIYLPG